MSHCLDRLCYRNSSNFHSFHLLSEFHRSKEAFHHLDRKQLRNHHNCSHHPSHLCTSHRNISRLLNKRRRNRNNQFRFLVECIRLHCNTFVHLDMRSDKVHMRSLCSQKHRSISRLENTQGYTMHSVQFHRSIDLRCNMLHYFQNHSILFPDHNN